MDLKKENVHLNFNWFFLKWGIFLTQIRIYRMKVERNIWMYKEKLYFLEVLFEIWSQNVQNYSYTHFTKWKWNLLYMFNFVFVQSSY